VSLIIYAEKTVEKNLVN